MRKSLCLLLIMLLFASAVFPQKMPMRSYTIRDGLISNSLGKLYRDSRGMLWFISGEGISRFDGKYFWNITKDNGLPDDFVGCVEESKKTPGIFYIGTRAGLSVYDGTFHTNYPLPDSMSGKWINALCETANGELLCGTKSGILRYSNGKFTSYKPRARFGFVAEIIPYPAKQAIIVNCDSGLLLVRPQSDSITVIPIPVRDKDDFVASVTILEDGSLLCVANSGALYKYDGKVTRIGKVSNDRVFSVCRDETGTFYLCTTGGLFRFRLKGNTITDTYRFSAKDGMPKHEARWGIADGEGNLWFTTLGSGVIKMAREQFVRFAIENGGTHASFDSRGQLWAMDKYGMWEYSRDGAGNWQKKFHRITSSIPDWEMWVFAIDRKDRLWLMDGNKANRSELRCFTATLAPDGGSVLSAPEFEISQAKGYPAPLWMSVYFDKDNILWYSTQMDGVTACDVSGIPVVLARYTTKTGIIDQGVRAIFEDSKRNLWLGGWERGLAKIDKSNLTLPKITNYTTRDGLPDNSIRAITEDNRGRIILATRYGGVSVISQNRFANYTRRSGLPSNQTWYAAYNDGRIIVGTSSGMAIANAKDTLIFTQMDELKGNPIGEVGGNEAAPLWFTDRYGVTLFTQDYFQKKHGVLPLYIRGVESNGFPLISGSPLQLNYNQNDIKIGFYVVSFSEQPVLYEYLLEGSENKWKRAATGQEVHFPALKPGAYSFKVRAVNGEGEIISTTATVPFEILSPLWQRPWFLFLFFCIGAFVSYRAVNWRLSRLRARQAELLQLIRQKEEAEIELRRHYELFEIINGNVSDLIAILDLNGKRQFSSKSFGNLFGDVDLLRGTDSFREIHPDDAGRIRELFRETVETGVGKRAEFRFILTDGSVRYIESQGNVIRNPEGKTTGVVVVSRDISERKNFEEALMQLNQSLENLVKERTSDLLETNEKLQNEIIERKRVDDELRAALERERELSELRAQFISMASHEFRTPLTAILTSSEIIENFYAQLTDAMRQNNFARIRENVKYMTRILNDILFIGKSDAGKLELKPEPVDIEKLCDDVIGQMNLLILNAGSAHTIHFEKKNLHPAALLDRALTKQILENVLSNAVKYSPQKTNIWFRAECDGSSILFEIRDEGIGISEDERHVMFEPFFRGRNAAGISGTGLGLVIVKRAAELHGGTISVSGSETGGTVFTITIPLTPAEIYE